MFGSAVVIIPIQTNVSVGVNVIGLSLGPAAQIIGQVQNNSNNNAVFPSINFDFD